jgi:uncharacterized protein
MFFEERVADLTRKMLRKKLYVVLSTPAVTPDKLQPFLSAHLEYMIGLEKRGHVFASGPLADGAGPPTGAGLTVLRARDLSEARALAEGDPFFVNRLRTFELKEWTLMEGTLGVRVNLSDQTIEVT